MSKPSPSPASPAPRYGFAGRMAALFIDSKLTPMIVAASLLLGFFAIIFLLSIITGIILYRKNIVAVLLFKKTVWKKNNLHQIIGT